MSATLTVSNRSSGRIGVSITGAWLQTVEANSSATIEADDHTPDEPPPLPWVAVVKNAQGDDLGSILVLAGMNAATTIANDGRVNNGAAMRSGCRATPNPYAGLPSNACGGFHLKVVNDTSGSVTVGINDAWTSTIATGANQVINEMFSQPKPPPMPWYVEISDGNGHAIFQGIAGDSPADQKITLTDEAAPSQAPYSIALEGCGPA